MWERWRSQARDGYLGPVDAGFWWHGVMRLGNLCSLGRLSVPDIQDSDACSQYVVPSWRRPRQTSLRMPACLCLSASLCACLLACLSEVSLSATAIRAPGNGRQRRRWCLEGLGVQVSDRRCARAHGRRQLLPCRVGCHVAGPHLCGPPGVPGTHNGLSTDSVAGSTVASHARKGRGGDRGSGGEDGDPRNRRSFQGSGALRCRRAYCAHWTS